MEKTQNLIQEKMKAKGLRITPQRYAVYANLLSRCDHPTVEQILEQINQDLPIASKASVYTALSVLRQVGLVREILLDEGKTRYDGRTDAHHHFVCLNCGSILDVEWDYFQDFPLPKLPQGLTSTSYEITVKGCCNNCQN